MLTAFTKQYKRTVRRKQADLGGHYSGKSFPTTISTRVINLYKENDPADCIRPTVCRALYISVNFTSSSLLEEAMVSAYDLTRYSLRLTFFVASNLYGMFGYCTWMILLLPIRLVLPDIFWRLESVIFKGLQSNVIVWMCSGGYGVIESGDDLRTIQDCESVLMCNHQSTADTPLVMMGMWSLGMCTGNSLWIMDWIFRFTHFGLISTIRRDFFIRQGKDTRNMQGILLEQHLKNAYLPNKRKWIVLFPEGGFLWKRKEISQIYAEKNGYPVLNHVTLPRIGALKTILDTIGVPFSDNPNADINENSDPEHPLKWVIDLTIGYLKGEAVDMFGMCVGYRKKQDVHLYYRAYPAVHIPRDSAGLLSWLYDRYVEKEQLLAYFYQHGSFPSETQNRVLPLRQTSKPVYDYGSVVMFQLFFFLTTYLDYVFILKPLINFLS